MSRVKLWNQKVIILIDVLNQCVISYKTITRTIYFEIVKNKIAPPFRIAEFDMMHSNGISYEGDILDLGVEEKIVNKSGSWFKYGDEHIGQGKEKARTFLVENPDVADEIKQKILIAKGILGANGEVIELPVPDETNDEMPEEELDSAAVWLNPKRAWDNIAFNFFSIVGWKSKLTRGVDEKYKFPLTPRGCDFVQRVQWPKKLESIAEQPKAPPVAFSTKIDLRIGHEMTTFYRHGNQARLEADGESCEPIMLECDAPAQSCWRDFAIERNCLHSRRWKYKFVLT